MNDPRVRACEFCKQEFRVAFPNIRKRFCSRACVNAARWPTAEIRFWALVDKNGPIPEHRPELGPCWLWTGTSRNGRYGGFTARSGPVLAHRFAFELANGAVRDGISVCHHCDNTKCVKNAGDALGPAHLFEGTHAENMVDMVLKGRAKHGACGDEGERNYNAKLTAEDVISIRALYAAGGVTQRQLAARFRVDQALIWGVLKRRIWCHVA